MFWNGSLVTGTERPKKSWVYTEFVNLIFVGLHLYRKLNTKLGDSGTERPKISNFASGGGGKQRKKEIGWIDYEKGNSFALV